MFLTTDKLRQMFEDKLQSARHVEIASAWVTLGPALDLLCEAYEKRRPRIRAMIGTFGNATDPDALDILKKIGDLCIVDGRKMLFHPKVYIFRNRRESCAWIGSANFTRAGFGRNEEVVYEVDNWQEPKKRFDKRWREHGGPSPDSAIAAYRNQRKRQGVSKAAAELAGQPEQGRASRAELLQGSGSWMEYIAALRQCDDLWRAEGSAWSVLATQYSYLHTITRGTPIARRDSWHGLTDQERTILLGLRDGVDGVWGLLGSLVGAGEVKGVFGRSQEAENKRILRRVRNAVGRVIHASDEDFPDVAVKALEQICAEKRFSYGVATRLLTLARPDKLVSVNKASRVGLATIFDLRPATLGNPRNYRKLLERIYSTPWYCGPPGRGGQERQIWSMRAALIDSFVYDPNT